MNDGNKTILNQKKKTVTIEPQQGHELNLHFGVDLDKWVSILVLKGHKPACLSCSTALQLIFKVCRSLLIPHSFKSGVSKQRTITNMQGSGPPAPG